jgi:hypothetical protein
MEIKDFITFGASVRVKNAEKRYENCVEEYNKIFKEMEIRKSEVEEELKLLVEEKIEALKSLKKIEKISENLIGKDRKFNNSKITLETTKNFAKIEKTISVGDAAISTVKGTVSGISTGVGAWALVSTFGTASTGTAISTLSGVAATNATLAWFGGGSIASGGLGMAGGGLVLGGIVVVPALILTGAFNHLKASKDIKRIENEIFKVQKSTHDVKNNILAINNIEKRSLEVRNSLKKIRKNFESELELTYKKIYPIPFISNLIKNIRKKVFNQDYFSNNDLKEISYIVNFAVRFSEIIDTKIFD